MIKPMQYLCPVLLIKPIFENSVPSRKSQYPPIFQGLAPALHIRVCIITFIHICSDCSGCGFLAVFVNFVNISHHICHDVNIPSSCPCCVNVYVSLWQNKLS